MRRAQSAFHDHVGETTCRGRIQLSNLDHITELQPGTDSNSIYVVNLDSCHDPKIALSDPPLPRTISQSQIHISTYSEASIIRTVVRAGRHPPSRARPACVIRAAVFAHLSRLVRLLL
ncbi:hypothetical protein EVAR_89087_1 [Eumeta japonica]|uniref:Uncharacterized protein n=1 Tax=Eumeta variegata TaxID=151549 RepID=A0A4C1XE52_EUMVA|nr:hypothetical protein EVAR_89087_1 [Eumeta japonica]